MNEQNNKERVLANLFWRFAERCGAQGVIFLVSIVLARILDTETYGTIALITVFINILQVFVDGGLGNALIQKKNADDLDFSTVFYFNVCVCVVLYIVMFFAAPYIANFYRDKSLTSVIRVLSMILVISGLKNVQQAYISKHMMFKRFFFATLGGTVGAAIVGISLAYLGCGIWALVVQQLFNAAVDTAILWITVEWRPKRVFSFDRLRVLFNYGWKLLAASLMDISYTQLRQLIIGRMYSKNELAYYNQGDKFPNVIVSNIDASIDSVLLPAMSNSQDDREEIKSMVRKSIMVSVYIMAPLMIGLCFIAEPVIRFVFTSKWLPCIPYLRIFCITYMFWPIHTANLNAIKALGRGDYFFKLEVMKIVIGFIVLFATMKYGVMAMAYSLLLTSLTGQIINAWPNRQLLQYGYLEQIKDILPSIISAFIMGGCISLISLLELPDFIQVMIQVLAGVVIYILLSKIFCAETYTYLSDIIKNKMSGLRKK